MEPRRMRRRIDWERKSAALNECIELHVHTLGGTAYQIRVSPASCVLDIKKQIDQMSGIPEREQKLVAGMSALGDDLMLRDVAQNELAHLTLIRRTALQTRWLELIKDYYAPMKFAPPEIQEDEECQFAAVTTMPSSLQWLLGRGVKLSLHVMQQAVRGSPGNIKYLKDPDCKELFTNELFVRQLLEAPCNWFLLALAPPQVRQDADLVLRIVKQNWLALALADATLRCSRQLIFAALRQNGSAMVFAAPELRRSDTELAAAALAALTYPDTFSNSNWLISELLQDRSSDRAFLLTAVHHDGMMLKFASQCLRSDRDLVLSAVAQNGLALQFAVEGLRADAQVVSCAVSNTAYAFAFAMPPLDYDFSLARMAALGCCGVGLLDEVDPEPEAKGDAEEDGGAEEGDELEEQQQLDGRHPDSLQRALYAVVGSWDDWLSFLPLVQVNLVGTATYSADIPIPRKCTKGTVVQFQVIEDEDWHRRYVPLCSHHEAGNWIGAMGPLRGDMAHGNNWTVCPSMCSQAKGRNVDRIIRVYWQPSRARGITWEILTQAEARKCRNIPAFNRYELLQGLVVPQESSSEPDDDEGEEYEESDEAEVDEDEEM